MRNIIKQILAVDDELAVAGEAEDGQVGNREGEGAEAPKSSFSISRCRALTGSAHWKRLKLISKAKVVIPVAVAQLGSAAAIEARRLGAIDVILPNRLGPSAWISRPSAVMIQKVVRAAVGLPPLDVSAMGASGRRKRAGKTVLGVAVSRTMLCLAVS